MRIPAKMSPPRQCLGTGEVHRALGVRDAGKRQSEQSGKEGTNGTSRVMPNCSMGVTVMRAGRLGTTEANGQPDGCAIRTKDGVETLHLHLR